MLIVIFVLLAAAGSAGVCFLTDAFGSLMWLWLLPVSFVILFLLAAVATFGLLVLICKCIDPDKPREKDNRAFRAFAIWCIQVALVFLPVRIHTRGLEKRLKGGRFLLVCNHLHEIDPAVLLYYFRKTPMAFIAKQEAKHMFLVNKAMPMLLCPYINRENDREALKTILRCIKLLKDDVVSIGVFPEGYIHQKRKLHHFRPGVFKIAQKANVPIVVCTLTNTHHVIKNSLKLKMTDVDMHVLDVIPAETVQSKSTTELAEEIYQMMAADLGPENVLSAEEENT